MNRTHKIFGQIVLELEAEETDKWGFDHSWNRTFYLKNGRISERCTLNGIKQTDGSYPHNSDYASERLAKFAASEDVTYSAIS